MNMQPADVQGELYRLGPVSPSSKSPNLGRRGKLVGNADAETKKINLKFQMELVRKSNCFKTTDEGRCDDHCRVDLQGWGKQGTPLGTSLLFWLLCLTVPLKLYK